MLILHVRRLEEGALAQRVYREQVANQWPGLAQEVDSICQELGVESALITKKSKPVYRNTLVKAGHDKNKEKIKWLSEGKIKCERILEEEYGRKKYINDERIDHVRETYKARFGLMPFAGNYRHDKRFSGIHSLCKCGEALEEESHLLSGNCEEFGDIRGSFGDLKDDKSLVQFFKEVLERRDIIDETEKQKQ